MSLTEAERTALERSRTGAAGISRAATALLLDHDPDEVLRLLNATEEIYSDDLARSLPPDPEFFGFSACDFAMLASLRVLSRPQEARELCPLMVAFEPRFSTSAYTGCTPLQREISLALLAFLAKDEPRAAGHLGRTGYKKSGLLDRCLAETISLMLRGRGAEVPTLLERFRPLYEEAMAQGLWRIDPDAFLHLRLLAALRVGHEQGRIELRTVQDVNAYVPISLITYRHPGGWIAPGT